MVEPSSDLTIVRTTAMFDDNPIVTIETEGIPCMDLELNGRVAIVTGASAGIGRGIATVLASEGAQTVLVARRASRLDELAHEMLRDNASRAHVIAADLYDAGVSERIAGEVLEKFGRVDILVNNAGGSRPVAVNADDAEWDESFAINFTALRKLTQAVISAMQAQSWGRIINITGALEPRDVNAAVAAKAAVHAWSKGLAVKVASMGITVNCIGPGRIHSEQIDQRLHPTAADREAFIASNIPIGYFGEPCDIGYMTAFLCSPKARYTTGQRINVDGGMNRAI
jgi:3-oxoacyl-[acyl-carrier protein] reductase